LNGPLTLEELDARRAEVFAGIAERGELWRIETPADGAFVLGPAEVLGRVVGLYDEEYGWPTPVKSDAPVRDFIPLRRRHPLIVDGQRPIAFAVRPGEYEDIVR
jgi:hypothetical protein